MNWHVPHDFFLHFEVFVSLESSGLSSNVNPALVRMPFKFCGCLLLLMSLNFFSASLNFGQAFRSGSVSLMVLNNSGLRGLKVVTNARMFSSAESFDFGSSSSCLGILFASSILWCTRPFGYPCLHKFCCSSSVRFWRVSSLSTMVQIRRARLNGIFRLT